MTLSVQKMQLTEQPSCYSAKDDSIFTRFILPQKGTLKYIKLVHFSGVASCHAAGNIISLWGCFPARPIELYEAFVVITDANKVNVYPPGPRSIAYVVPGLDEMADEFVFQPAGGYPVEEGEEMRVYHSEAHRRGGSQSNNAGEHCIHVVVEYF